MTKLDWNRPKKIRSVKGKSTPFPAKYQGVCANCHVAIAPKTLIVIADHRPVHYGGCPAK